MTSSAKALLYRQTELSTATEIAAALSRIFKSDPQGSLDR